MKVHEYYELLRFYLKITVLVSLTYHNKNTMNWQIKRASQVVVMVKNLPANTGDLRDVGLITGSGRSPGGGNGNPLQNSCLENPTDRGAWRAIGLWSMRWQRV